MEITIDTSALLSVCSNEASKPRLIALTAGCDLLAPGSVHWEIGNALSAMVKRKRVSLAQAQQCADVYSGIPIKFVEVDLGQALAIASRFRMYAYDAYLLACASQTGTPLLTLDLAMQSAANQLGISILEVEV